MSSGVVKVEEVRVAAGHKALAALAAEKLRRANALNALRREEKDILLAEAGNKAQAKNLGDKLASLDEQVNAQKEL